MLNLETMIRYSFRKLAVMQNIRKHGKRETEQYFIAADAKLSKAYKAKIDRYWKQFGVKVSGEWHRLYYDRTGVEDVRFIDSALWHSKMVYVLNRKEMRIVYDDKNMYDVILKDVPRPHTIVRKAHGILLDQNGKILEEKHAIERCMRNKKIILKPALMAGAGQGIIVLSESEDYQNQIQNAFDGLKDDFIVQEFMRQADCMNVFGSSAVCTVRINSLLWGDGVRICDPILRIGAPSAEFVYGHEKCYVCGITDDGMLKNNWFISDVYRPVKLFEQAFAIPNYHKIISIIERCHSRFPYMRFIGWDFAIDQNEEPVLLEINTDAPGPVGSQLTDGPLFGDLTEEVARFCLIPKSRVVKAARVII